MVSSFFPIEGLRVHFLQLFVAGSVFQSQKDEIGQRKAYPGEILDSLSANSEVREFQSECREEGSLGSRKHLRQ